MKKINLLMIMACIAVTFSACKSNKEAKQNAEDATKVEDAIMTGSDKDEHGCIGSAGYVWSELKKDCIRPFEAGMKIAGITEENKTTAAFVVFDADSAKAELFIPEVKGGVILEHAGDEWKNDAFSVTCKNGKWNVSENGKVTFANN